MAQVPECVVCLQPYDDFRHVPRVLACGHSFCELCLMQLQSAWQPSSSSLLSGNNNNNSNDDIPSRPASGAVIRCPECNHRTRLPVGGQQSLPKNVELLRLLPSLIREPAANSLPATNEVEGKQSEASVKVPSEENGTQSNRGPPPPPPSTTTTSTTGAPGRRDHKSLAIDSGVPGIRSGGDGCRRPPKLGEKVNTRVDPNYSTSTSTSRSVVDSWLLPCNLYSNNSNPNPNSSIRRDLRSWILPEKAIKLRPEGGKDSSSSSLEVVDNNSQKTQLLWGEIVLEQDGLSSSIPVRSRQLKEVRCTVHAQNDDETTTMTYEECVLRTWEGCHGLVKTELLMLFRVSLLSRGLCNVLGVWMNPQRNALFLVTQIPAMENTVSAWQIFKNSFQSGESSAEFKSGKEATSLSSVGEITQLELGESSSHAHKFSCSGVKQIRLSRLGLDLGSALWEVHSQGFIFGLLSPDCFVLDRFDSLLIDFNEALSERSSLHEATARLSGVSSECGPEGRRESVNNDPKEEVDGQKNYRNCCWRYMSPEALSLLMNKLAKVSDDVGNTSTSSRLTCKTDVWSLGCLLLELVSGKAPFEGLTFPEVLQRVLVERERPGDFFGLLDSSTGHAAADCMAHVGDGNHSLKPSPISDLAVLLSKCFEFDPDERPELDTLLRNFQELGGSNVIPSMRNSSLPVQHLQRAQAEGSGDQKYWVFCLPGFVRDGYFDSLYGREDNAQESQRSLELNIGAADEARDLQPCGLEQKGSLEGHRDYVTALAVCGDYLLSASFDKTIRVWSLEDNALRQTLEGHSIVVMALAVDHNTSRCFSGDTGGKICAWKIGEGIAEPLLATWQDHDDWRYTGVASLAVSADEILYSGSGDRTIKAWSLQNFSQLGTMEGHKGLVSALLVDGELLYSGSWDGTIRVWWRNDQSLVAVLGGNTTSNPSQGGVRTLCMSDSFLFAGRDSGAIQVWRDEECLTTVKAHDTVVSSVYVEGDFLYTGSWDEQIKAWQVDQFLSDPAPTLVRKCGFALSSIVSDGDQLYAGLADRAVKVYSLLGDTWASLMQML
ncbi:unnamed protein product [Calypogeia fissa]